VSRATGTGAREARDPSALVRLSVSGASGVLGGGLMAALGPWWLIPLAFWDASALVFVSWMWRTLWPMGAAETARRARREDPGRAARDALVLAASMVSLVAVGLVLVRAGHTGGLQKGLLLGTTIISIVLSWSVIHTVFSVRYARLYYDREPGGVDFNEEEDPAYTDFAYLSLTIGMTFQVSDTDLQTKAIRRAALGHALLSYTFGALIIATTVNLIAGLSK
jgi:uncharacterized membrane protein